jgi:hypothetical protein
VSFKPCPDGSGVISVRTAPNPSGPSSLRSLAVDYSGASGAPGLFAVVDKVSGAEGKTIFWQLVTERSNRVTVDGSRFVIHGRDGAALHGTVVAPASPQIETADVDQRHEVNYHDIHRHDSFARTVIRVAGSEFFMVVMTIQKGDPPRASVRGRDAEAEVQVGEQMIRFDGEKIILVAPG